MRTISPSEFIRRLKHGIVAHEGRIVWFLGAGCSVSSGVEDAGMLTQYWLKDLKYLETGDSEGLEQWAEGRFPTYSRTDPAAAYIQVHEALFYTDQDQQREQERLSTKGQPGFGYATLAQLLAHEKWGERCNTVITTNFDDLAADALYLYSQRKPQVLTHESFDRHVQISDARPTIVKLYGDAHLGAEYLDGNHRLLRKDVKERLRALATECTLVFVGYGGRDDCILDLLADMPLGAPSGGVFWVNDKAPGHSLAEWMEERRAVWAQNDSFDELMYLLRQEFELGHPRIDRFDQILQKYDDQYRALAKKSHANSVSANPVAEVPDPVSVDPVVDMPIAASKTMPPVQAPAAFAEAIAAEEAKAASFDTLEQNGQHIDDDTDVVEFEEVSVSLDAPGMMPLTFEVVDDRPLAGEPIIEAIVAMKARAAVDAAHEAQKTATIVPPLPVDPVAEPAPASEGSSADVAVSASDIDELADEALQHISPELETFQRDGETPFGSISSVPMHDTHHAAADDVLELNEEANESDFSEGSRERIDALVAAAVKAMAIDSASDLVVEPAEAAPTVTPDDEISNAPPVGAVPPPLHNVIPQPLPDRQRVVPIRASVTDITDILPEPPMQDGPLTVPVRLMRREEAAALDEQFRAALADNSRDADLLADYAQFLTVGRQDHDGAEHYFNRAVDADPQNERVQRLFAAFLTTIRRDYDRAEDCYRLAIRANFENPETMCDYAEFLWYARGDFETAGECFQVAVDAAPRDARALSRYAKFLQEIQRNDDAAYALLKLAAASADTDPGPIVALAQFRAARRDDLEKAESTFADALKVAPESADVLIAAAGFYADKRENYGRAQELLDTALDVAPESTTALQAYALFLHTKRGDVRRAGKMLQLAIEIDPGDARLAATYAQFRDEVLSDDDGAEDTFRKAINLDPRDATVLARYGRFLHYSRRKANAAYDRLRKAVAMEPRNPLALRSYGWFLVLERKEREEGERYLRRAVSAAPSDPEALADLAEFLSQQPANREETEEMFRRALAADPSNKNTMRRYARFMSHGQGDPSAADAMYRRVLDNEPRDARALGGSAHSLFIQGRKEEGLATLEKAFDAAMGGDLRRRDVDLLLELWFYRFAFDQSAAIDAIKAAVWMVKEGAKVPHVNLNPIVARAVLDGHAEPDILRELAMVVSGSTSPERLERFSAA